MLLLAALIERFRDHRPRVGAATEPLVNFPAKHASIGDVTIERPDLVTSTLGSILLVRVAIGNLFNYEFENFDAHLGIRRRAERLTEDVVRFLQELFADRLVFWQAADGGSRGWREWPYSGSPEPLVSDDRLYRIYIWSWPVGEWQASPCILARGEIRDDREYHILKTRMAATDQEAPEATAREMMVRVIAEYERGHAV